MQALISTTANWCLGHQGQIPWYDQEEQHRFRSLTIGATLVMGRKTFEADYPWMRGRRKIVLSRNLEYAPEGATVLNTIEEIAKAAPDAWVVGGGMGFQAFVPHINHLFLTKFPQSVHGDVWLPDISWSLWITQGKTQAYGRELLMLRRRPLARAQTSADSSPAPTKQRGHAKDAK